MNDFRQNLLFENKKILIVDDEIDIIEIIGYTLKKEGFNYRSALDGEQCLNMIESYNPDIVLLDIMMPKLTGVEVCRILRNNPKYNNIIIIFLSALNDELSQIRALEEGGDEYITKPISPKLLLAIIKAQISRSLNISIVNEGKNNG